MADRTMTLGTTWRDGMARLAALFAVEVGEGTVFARSLPLCRHLALGCLSLLAVVAVLGMAMWVFQPAWMVEHAYFLFYMKFNTALFLFIGGMGALCILLGKWNWALPAGLLLTGLGAATFFQYGMGISLGIDEFFVRDLLHPGVPYPGRISPGAATMFMLAGSALLVEGLPFGRDSLVRTIVGEFLSLSVVGLASFALAGYVAGQPLAYTWGSATRMSIPTAFCAVMLGSGIAFSVWAHREVRASRLPYWVPLMLGFSVMVFDLCTPLGVAAGIGYIPLVFCGLWFTRMYTPFVFAGLGSLLTIGGYYLSPPGPLEGWIVLTNRGLTITALWVVATLVYLSHRAYLQQTQSQARLKALVDTTVNGIITHDRRGIIMAFNPACERMFGHTQDEVMGKSVVMLFPLAHKHQMHLLNRPDGSFGQERDTEGLRKDGSVFPIQLSVTSIDLEGERTYSMILRDVTEAKQMEKLLRDSSDKLAAHNVALERSNQELEQFAYMASHDLQEPLRMVRSYCALLQEKYEGQLDKEGEEYLHFAVDGAERMQQLIRDLLVYSRASRNEFQMREVDFSSVLQEVRANLKGTLDATGAVIKVESALPTVTAERTMVVQVMQNLMSNAVKFHKPDARPEVLVQAEMADGGWVFSVKDNGIGLDTKYSDKIFEMFKRLHSRDEFEGTGIGLAVCKRIVERHGGSIWVESVPGEGATFKFQLPKVNNGNEQEGASA